MKWTSTQQSVIDTRNKNILVSAAAGSGKTAVLVERIIQRIMDEKDPVDVDKILVVTFTNAAAAEMKERVRKALDKAVLADPKNSRLRTQATLVHTAQIRTIDSFCSYIVKNYFYEIDADPAFRIGDSGAIKLLKEQALDEALAASFENPTEDFRLLADAYMQNKKSVETFKQLVYDINDKASSYAWPEDWFKECKKLYGYSKDNIKESPFVKYIVERSNGIFKDLAKDLRTVLGFYAADDTSKDGAILRNELALYEALSLENDFEKLQEITAGMEFDTLRLGAKGSGAPKECVEEIKKVRDTCKTAARSVQKEYFAESLNDIAYELEFVGRQVGALLSLTEDFRLKLSELKKKKGIFEFNDIEHMALHILRNKDSEAHEKRAVAAELSDFFREVMVDEYQDSNDLQEAILTAVCTDNNYFTVGDVKQSIYAFRQASPALFNEKFHSYPDREGAVRIDLDSNFRSRSEVLEFSNRIFYKLMQQDMGKVAYDDAAALKPGARGFEETGFLLQPEVLVANSNKEDLHNYGFDNATAMEAQMVADKIKELISKGFLVSDNTDDIDRKLQRKATLKDIVILFRGVKNQGPVFCDVLKKNGIPAYLEEETGFFDRQEVRDVLSLLQVISNPFNDIPLAAVMHSPIFGFTPQRLAEIRIENPGLSFHGSIFEYAKNHPKGDVADFLEFINRYRSQSLDTPIHELIQKLLKETGYFDYVLSLPMGENGGSNLHKIIDEAIGFEAGSNQGLSGFVSYIDNLKTYQVDPGVARMVGENEEAVRIMTIHKSKGLEFPIVFVSGCGHNFRNDTAIYHYHDDAGLTLKYKNPRAKCESNTVFNKVVAELNKTDNFGEEQRILYVALTRAKEKLFITGTISDLKEDENILERYSCDKAVLSLNEKLNSKSYLEWILRALSCDKKPYSFNFVNCCELLVTQLREQTSWGLAKEALKRVQHDVRDDLATEISQRLEFKYDGLAESRFKTKYSVSEIKHYAIEEALATTEEDITQSLFANPEGEPYIPQFARADTVSDETPAGALYGSAMHRVMECLDFTSDDLEKSLEGQLDYMRSAGLVSEDEMALVSKQKLKKFCQSDLAKRMQAAQLEGLLYREQPFVCQCSAKEALSGLTEDEEDCSILVQGIIDVFFKEKDGIVLMDYKTDRVDAPHELVLRYEKQLALYADAISKAYRQPVKEILIYSFYFNEVIACTIK